MKVQSSLISSESHSRVMHGSGSPLFSTARLNFPPEIGHGQRSTRQGPRVACSWEGGLQVGDTPPCRWYPALHASRECFGPWAWCGSTSPLQAGYLHSKQLVINDQKTQSNCIANARWTKQACPAPPPPRPQPSIPVPHLRS